MKRSAVSLRRLPACLGAATALGWLASAAGGDPSPQAKVPTASAAVAEGAQKVADQDFKGAVPLLEKAVKEHPSDYAGQHYLALAYLHSGAPAKAAGPARKAYELGAGGLDAHAADAVLLGNALFAAYAAERGDWQAKAGGLAGYDQLMRQMSVRHFDRPVDQLMAERVSSVVADEAQFQQQGDSMAADEAAQQQSEVREQGRRLEQLLTDAETAFRAAQATAPHLSGLHHGYGLVLAAEGYRSGARREFEAERDEHGDDGALELHMGELDAQEDDPVHAIAHLRRAVELSPNLKEAYAQLVPLFDKQKQPGEAQWARGMEALLKGRLKDADGALAKVSPPTADSLRGQAIVADARGDTAGALKLLHHALGLEPRDAQTLLTLGDMQAKAGQDLEALAAYRKTLDADPSCDGAWYGIGLAEDRLKEPAKAQDAYKRALALRPNNPAARLNLAADEADGGAAVSARDDLRDYLERYPNATDAFPVRAMLTQLESAH